MEDTKVKNKVTCFKCGAPALHVNTSECVAFLKKENTKLRTENSKCATKAQKAEDKVKEFKTGIAIIENARQELYDLGNRIIEVSGIHIYDEDW